MKPSPSILLSLLIVTIAVATFSWGRFSSDERIESTGDTKKESVAETRPDDLSQGVKPNTQAIAGGSAGRGSGPIRSGLASESSVTEHDEEWNESEFEAEIAKLINAGETRRARHLASRIKTTFAGTSVGARAAITRAGIDQSEGRWEASYAILSEFLTDLEFPEYIPEATARIWNAAKHLELTDDLLREQQKFLDDSPDDPHRLFAMARLIQFAGNHEEEFDLLIRLSETSSYKESLLRLPELAYQFDDDSKIALAHEALIKTHGKEIKPPLDRAYIGYLIKNEREEDAVRIAENIFFSEGTSLGEKIWAGYVLNEMGREDMVLPYLEAFREESKGSDRKLLTVAIAEIEFLSDRPLSIRMKELQALESSQDPAVSNSARRLLQRIAEEVDHD